MARQTPTPRAQLNPGEFTTYVRNAQRLEDIFSSLADMVQIIDVATLKPVYANKSMLELLEYGKAQIAKWGTDWPNEVIHSDDKVHVSNHLSNFPQLQVGERSRITFRAKDSAGRWRFFESMNTALSQNEHSECVLAIGYTREISESNILAKEVIEKHTDHRCRNCKKLLGVENTSTAVLEIKCVRCGEINALLRHDLSELFLLAAKKVYLTDENGVILFANAAVLEVSGFTPEEVIGKTPAIWGKQMTAEFYQEMYQKIKVEKRSISHVVTNKKKDGTLYRASVQISPILDEAGDIQYFVGIEEQLKD